MKKACIIGWPVTYSRSPLIHNYWIRQYGIDAIYEKVPVKPGEIPDFISGFRNSGFVGCNVTAPHKETVFHAVNTVDAAARRLGALNTLYIRNGNLHGTNTDGEGYLANLQHNHPTYEIESGNVMILGAGGAAKAIIGALVDAGAKRIGIINRTTVRTEALQSQFGNIIVPIKDENGASAMARCDLLVNTTSLGMSSQPPLDFDLSNFPLTTIVSDIVYSPLETSLLKQARIRGNPTLGGLGMLLHQAVRGFELWFGERPEVTTELYDIVAADVSGAQK
jgi:shikimate dehydrogenase